MKRKLLVTVLLCLLMTLVLAFSVNAECETHKNEWTVKLGTSGFLGESIAQGECTECGTKTTEKIPTIFITRGYSYIEDGGIAQGYGVNKEALQRYEELSGEKLRFGGVVAIRDVIGNKNPLDKDASPVSDKVKVVDFTDTKFSIINVMVKGIPESARGSVEIICALYINVNGRTTYVDNRAEKTSCGEKSFDAVVASPTPDTTVLESYDVIQGQRYHQLTMDELALTQGMFWNNSSIQNNGSNAAFNNKFWTTGVCYDKEDLPNGTIITVDSDNGWQYRPHKWAGTRPENTKEKRVVIDDAWWGSFTYVGFNIGKYDGQGATQSVDEMLDISGYSASQIAEIFKIFVPVNDSSDSEEVEPEPNPDYSAQKQDWDEDGALKILCIGNSFSVDSMQYVYQVAEAAGVDTVVLGNLYIGGCSLATHLSNAQNDSGAYTYYTNTSGSWSSRGGVSIKTAVQSDDWDFISVQQVSGSSGVSSTYSSLDALLDIVEPLNPSARLVWHMTWAYQTGSGHADFSKYNKDQMTMYNAIVGAVKDNILTEDRIEIVIPAGTAIQNVRTSYIGDTLTRDGYHLTEDLGRFIGSLTFVKALTGISIDNMTYTPSGVDANELAVAIECVNNAVKTPFEVTASSFTSEPGSGDSGEGGDTGEDGDVIAGYNQLGATDMGIMTNSYYNTSGSNVFNSSDSFAQGYYATKKFTKEELPVGTVIEIASGWQYRPEGWSWAGSRPDNVTTSRIVIDEAWWGSYTERAFNISQVGHTTTNIIPITLTPDEVAKDIFKIFVPTSEQGGGDTPEVDTPEDDKAYVSSSDCVEETVTIDGVEYRALTIEAMGLTGSSYYYSEKQGPTLYLDGANTAKKFFATKTFTKDTLPEGAVIWVNSGWQYRPEGWVNGSLNDGSSRPANVSTTYVTADSAWWKDWTVRGFNISKTNGADISGYTNEQVYENFKIYIPVDNIVEEGTK